MDEYFGGPARLEIFENRQAGAVPILLFGYLGVFAAVQQELDRFQGDRVRLQTRQDGYLKLAFDYLTLKLRGIQVKRPGRMKLIPSEVAAD